MLIFEIMPMTDSGGTAWRCEELPLMCWFLDADNNKNPRALNWPACKKRQGTKSRAVGHWLAARF